jgi:hypothetical protein
MMQAIPFRGMLRDAFVLSGKALHPATTRSTHTEKASTISTMTSLSSRPDRAGTWNA